MSTLFVRSFVVVAVAVTLASSGCSDPASHTSEGELGTVGSALTTLVVEAEGATGGGAVVESDATASGGQRIAMTTSQAIATKSFTTTGTAQSATVRMRATQCGTLPWGSVLVDGVVRLTTQILVDAWTTFPLSVAGLGAGNHTIGFQDRSNPTGCIVRFDQATFTLADPVPPPVTLVVEAEGATGGGAVVESDATASGGQRIAMTTSQATATKSFTTTGSVISATARIRATQCGGSPYASILVDGSVWRTMSVTADVWTTYDLTPLGLGAGNHTLGFQDRSNPPGCVVRFDKATFITN